MLERDLGVIVDPVIVFVRLLITGQVGHARFAEELSALGGSNPDRVVPFVDGFSTAHTSACCVWTDDSRCLSSARSMVGALIDRVK